MALPKFEDFVAPWELKDGKPVAEADQVIDKAQLKKHWYNVLQDKEKAQVARDTALATNTELTGKVTELEKTVAEKGAEGLSETQKLQKSIEALTERTAKAELERDRTKVMADAKLKPEAEEFLVGKTLAELKASADKLVTLGLTVETTDGEQAKVDKDGNPIQTAPVVKERQNPGDPLEGGGAGTLTVDEFVKDFELSNGSVFG